ncbi:MAG: RNase adapter RapZ [Tissierellia bacterium]|nr:RNase adapter RapZ [Tissierellia bacterium]
MRLLVITGLSGAGKSQALKVAEDLGYYCVDNMPLSLVPNFLEVAQEANLPQVAIVIDIRARQFFSELSRATEALEKMDNYRTIFLEADDDVLIKRYKELRRPHPLGDTLEDGIRKERRLMADLRSSADDIVDTSDLSNHGLKLRMRSILGRVKDRLSLSVISFGFKHGILAEADLVFDVRFIPNPYYIPELKPHSGLTEQTRDYVLSSPQAQSFLDWVQGYVGNFAGDYLREAKENLVVGIGCTGGYHRSVAIAAALAQRFEEGGYPVLLGHRDLERHG